MIKRVCDCCGEDLTNSNLYRSFEERIGEPKKDLCFSCYRRIKNEICKPKNRNERTEVIHGKWIDNHNGTYTCSECGNKHSKANYCCECGADMRKPPIEEEIGDCNICRFVGCSECDDCVNGSQWVRAIQGVDYDYE